MSKVSFTVKKYREWSTDNEVVGYQVKLWKPLQLPNLFFVHTYKLSNDSVTLRYTLILAAELHDPSVHWVQLTEQLIQFYRIPDSKYSIEKTGLFECYK